jgi:hypothetical protein
MRPYSTRICMRSNSRWKSGLRVWNKLARRHPCSAFCDSAHYRNSHFGKWPATWAKCSWLLMPLSANPIWAKSLLLHLSLNEERAWRWLSRPSDNESSRSSHRTCGESRCLCAAAAAFSACVFHRRDRVLRWCNKDKSMHISIPFTTCERHPRLIRCSALISRVHFALREMRDAKVVSSSFWGLVLFLYICCVDCF